MMTRVLIVEDDAAIARELADGIGQEGFSGKNRQHRQRNPTGRRSLP